MSSIDSFTAALSGLKQAYEAGRLAHAYLVVGSPRGDALAFTEAFLQYLFCRERDKPCGKCPECGRVKRHEHPDILWLQPETKSRRIDIEQIRDELTPRICRTSYGGGWKVGVILYADRLTDGAANAFLKTLEEPPGSSLLLLVTNSVQHLLPTIASRCQRIILSSGQAEEEGPWQVALLDVLRRGPPSDSIEVLVQSGRLKAILNEVKKTVDLDEQASENESKEDSEEIRNARIAARSLEIRMNILRKILLWKRDVLMAVVGMGDEVLHFHQEHLVIRQQAKILSVAQALSQVEAVEDMIRRFERNLPEEAVFEVGLRGKR